MTTSAGPRGSEAIEGEPDSVTHRLADPASAAYPGGMTDPQSSNPALRSVLLAGLAPFRREGVSGTTAHATGLFSYCALSRERLSAVRLERPILGVVLSGAKEVWCGDVSERLSTGAVFVLPAGVDLDVVNDPDEASSLYQSLVLEVEPDAIPDAVSIDCAPTAGPTGFAVTPSADLVAAIVHAARAIGGGPSGAAVRGARLTELLALLRGEPAARSLFDMSVAERVARLVRGELDRNWTAVETARRLALSESTLRRRLAGEGHSFSAILRRERMEAARRLLAHGSASGAAAYAVGYASRAHFARAFRAVFGDNPGRCGGRSDGRR